MKLLKKTLLLLLIFVVSAVKAQYNGFPIRNYAQKEYNAFMQNWFCVQDKRGVLYFGNSSNVLEYDGKMSDSLADTPYLHLQGFYHQIILQDLE